MPWSYNNQRLDELDFNYYSHSDFYRPVKKNKLWFEFCAKFTLVSLDVVFVLLRQYYQMTAREVKRLDGVLRSPLYNHVTNSMNGYVSIKGEYHHIHMYYKQFLTPRLSELEILSDATSINQSKLVSRLFANIYRHLSIALEHLSQFS